MKLLLSISLITSIVYCQAAFARDGGGHGQGGGRGNGHYVAAETYSTKTYNPTSNSALSDNSNQPTASCALNLTNETSNLNNCNHR